MNISAMNGIYANCAIDWEYLRIMRELRALGIEPTGDKFADKNKLREVKAQQRANQMQEIQFVSKSEKSEKSGAESPKDNLKNDLYAATEQMRGATQLAELNKYLLG